MMGSAALVLGLILVTAMVRFGSVWIASDSCNLRLRIGFVKTIE